MRIDLRRRNTFMPEHFLYGAQIGAAFNQVGCKRMPEGMRANRFLNSGEHSQIFDHQKDINPA